MSFSEYYERCRTAVKNTIELQVNDKSPDYLYQPIRYILSKEGKYIRPTLLQIFADHYQAERQESVKAASAVELFHVFSLVHDDIMDQDEYRRGHKTVHHQYDVATAILAGDGLIALSYKVMADVKSPVQGQIRLKFADTILEVCEGQGFDKEFESRKSIDVDSYCEMIRLKTAVLLAFSCYCGALLGSKNDAVAESAYRFGINLGMAFQIQDDILDLFGSADSLGKDIGSDFINDKKSILSVLSQHLDCPKLSQFANEHDYILELRQLLSANKIDQEAYQIKAKYEREAERFLTDLNHSKFKEYLVYLIESLKKRQS